MSAKSAFQSAPSYGFAPQSTDGVMIEVQRLNRDHVLTRMGLHGRTFFELIYFERGGGSHALGGIRSPVEPGCLFVICPGELHDARRLAVLKAGYCSSHALPWSRARNRSHFRGSGFPGIHSSIRFCPWPYEAATLFAFQIRIGRGGRNG